MNLAELLVLLKLNEQELESATASRNSFRMTELLNHRALVKDMMLDLLLEQAGGKAKTEPALAVLKAA